MYLHEINQQTLSVYVLNIHKHYCKIFIFDEIYTLYVYRLIYKLKFRVTTYKKK